ncbi:MAG: hypothetical protein U1E18_29470 [Brevundimonas sp.]|uniref:hypothetical protein n=1 Tax=Brevundimonas sp. TaxID=1871086 RepID=UPI002ABAF17B|nr:hypothetical protein [Brevundimonas sp.]MDZ4113699.1 hypothetical protein [Brevundimonas sp.]
MTSPPTLIVPVLPNVPAVALMPRLAAMIAAVVVMLIAPVDVPVVDTSTPLAKAVAPPMAAPTLTVTAFDPPELVARIPVPLPVAVLSIVPSPEVVTVAPLAPVATIPLGAMIAPVAVTFAAPPLLVALMPVLDAEIELPMDRSTLPVVVIARIPV